MQRDVIFSTTVFLKYEDEYLMMHRSGDVSVDKNKLNGIGGKLEKGENFLDAAIRETKEETGYEVAKENLDFAGIIKLYGGYPQDWVMCFFTVHVSSKDIPHGKSVKEGELLWMHKDKVLTSDYELVDDLHYCWEEIISGNMFFITEKVNDQEKVEDISMSVIPAKNRG
ncbi:MAG: NUDIX domain-containing protein [Patescibacteria group bacterium]|nr:NUDIX domain-containing protein [Patescibacteria group bacterium]MDE2588227.1 NUDIX domain-containing protein [Patescibacteria group bacterium]